MKFDSSFWSCLQKIVDESKVIIDRPKGTVNPRFPNSVPYPLDYGYLDGTSSMDKKEVDCFVGTLNVVNLSGILCTVDAIKKDFEIKLLISCSDSEMLSAYNYINNTDFGKAVLIKSNYTLPE